MEEIEKRLDEEDTQKDRYLTFKLAKETYGVEIKYVTEIVGMQPINEVPELPDYVKGIINLRGKIIPVMDVRLRFNKPIINYNDRTCIIVVEIMDSVFGLIVDSVSEVINIPESEIVVPPSFISGSNAYIKGIDKSTNEVKLMLDCNKLLFEQVSVMI